MSYLVLARKYRPRRFEQLVGQEHVVQALSHALDAGRLHHAYLFTGTRGVGKTTVSRILAKSLNCTGADGQGGITSTPCGTCSACRDIDAGRHVDYVELDAASNRGVDEISQLLDQAVYKPVVGRFKVYMIDEVHMLSNTAFNAMLKTLEEPPEYLKFVLATTDPQKVPPTVLSRCLQFNLRPMAPANVQSHLQQVLEAESVQAEPAALRLLARAARGSMRDALSLTDQAIAYGGGQLAADGVRRMLGAVDRSHALDILQALHAGDAVALLATADRIRDWGLSAAGLLDELATSLQSLAVARALPGALEADDDAERATLEALAASVADDEIQLWYSMALHGREELPLAPDEHSGLVMVLLRMLAFRSAGGGGSAQKSPVRAPASVPGGTGSQSAASAGGSKALRRDGASASLSAALPTPARPSTSRLVDLDQGARSAQVQASSTAPAVVDAATDMRRIDAASAPLPGAPDDASLAPHAEAPPSQTPAAAVDANSQAVPASPRAAPTNPLVDRWVEIVSGMVESGAIVAMVRELALQAELVQADADGRWCLRVERESLRTTTQRDRLQAALSKALNQDIRLELEAGSATDSPAIRDAAARARLQQEAERIIQDDPDVKALLERFGTARIVPGSIKPTEHARP